MKKPAPFKFRLRLDIGFPIPAKQLKKLARIILIVTVYQLLDQHPVVIPEHPRIVTARPAPDIMRRLPGQLAFSQQVTSISRFSGIISTGGRNGPGSRMTFGKEGIASLNSAHPQHQQDHAFHYPALLPFGMRSSIRI
jgi:hypothetical protein